MNEDIKKQWLLDLRDGTRTQGQDCLRDEDLHQCCLDVLMEQAEGAGIVPPPVYNPMEQCWGYQREINEYEQEACLGDEEGKIHEFSVLTPDVATWAGLNSIDPVVNYPGDMEAPAGVRTLSGCNDHLRLTFNQIADLIEEQL